ncbi:hypothetical protein [Myxococcus landrumensis]|uniref:Uncharacterized protein n=1 Tax=Myxococcus landrumensis TaxID=2813577 RepID=A0ABX7N5S4_9BACT|nr:hypothetical protein [Myxococcus landrumus]QSQ14081.1 hypothetical protein JY572_38165 [Myxococcus landrumus]
MSIERIEWSTLSPPAYQRPRTVEVAMRWEESNGRVHRATWIDTSGDLLAYVRTETCFGAAIREVEDNIACLKRVLANRPAGIPFDRNRAQ